jgi:hypothetical protein
MWLDRARAPAKFARLEALFYLILAKSREVRMVQVPAGDRATATFRVAEEGGKVAVTSRQDVQRRNERRCFPHTPKYTIAAELATKMCARWKGRRHDRLRPPAIVDSGRIPRLYPGCAGPHAGAALKRTRPAHYLTYPILPNGHEDTLDRSCPPPSLSTITGLLNTTAVLVKVGRQFGARTVYGFCGVKGQSRIG